MRNWGLHNVGIRLWGKKNVSESLRWLRMAAENGDVIAQFHLGIKHALGQN